MIRSSFPGVDALDLLVSVLLFGHAAAHRAALRFFKLGHNRGVPSLANCADGTYAEGD